MVNDNFLLLCFLGGIGSIPFAGQWTERRYVFIVATVINDVENVERRNCAEILTSGFLVFRFHPRVCSESSGCYPG